MIMHDATE